MNLKQIGKYSRIALGRISARRAIKRGMKDGVARKPPQVVYWIQHTQCNLNCAMCNVPAVPLAQEKPFWLSDARMSEIVNELADMGVPNLGISGGEPLLVPDRLLRVLETANARGIYTHFGTNGILLTEEILREYDAIGGGHISLSVDGTGEVHDKIRGKRGVWESGVVRVLELFDKIKPRNVLLKINAILSDENVENLPELVEFMAQRGHMIFIQPFDPCDYHFLSEHKNPDIAHEKHPQWIPASRLPLMNKALDAILEIEKKHPGTLMNDREHIDAIRRYFSFDLLSERTPCTLGFKNLWIRANGDIFFCIYGHIGNVRETSVSEIWNCENMIEARKIMLSCRFVCLLGCMFDPSLASLAKKGISVARRMLK